jgi:pimeloyl-ACP methyl ester carboxylesterase
MQPHLVLCLAASFAVSGCVHVRLSARDLLTPDDPPAAAHLAASYFVEETSIDRSGRTVGITRAHRPGNDTVIIFCGGDRFHRSMEGGAVLTALARNADVVLFDYPGFGTSTGTPSPASILDNARAVGEYVARLATAARQKRVLYGFSLGGVVAAQLAAEQPVDGVVLEATSPDVASWARTQVPWFARPFVRLDLEPALARIDNVRALSGFSGRILVLAGDNDSRAPAALSRKIARGLTAHGRKVELREFAGAGHGEIYRSPQFQPTIDRFLADLGGAQ